MGRRKKERLFRVILVVITIILILALCLPTFMMPGVAPQ
jgi:hypothetical protein